MRTLAAVLLLSAVCAQAQATAAIDAAEAAYGAKDFKRCAELFAAAAKGGGRQAPKGHALE